MSTFTIPDVWTEAPSGTTWCDCGGDHALDHERIESFARDLFGGLPDRITHPGVIALAAEVWNYIAICEFFTGRVADAATDVNGEVAADYPLTVGLAIVKRFSDRWNGCPMENCAGDIDPRAGLDG